MGKSNRSLWTAKLCGSKNAAKVSSLHGEKTAVNSAAKKPTLAKEKKFSEIERKICGKKFEGVVLGIDPSLRGTGLAVLKSENGKISYLESLTIKNKPSLSFAECIGQIHLQTQKMLKKHSPKCVVVEASVYVQNFRIAMTLGAARGAAIAEAASMGLEIFEYPPLRIKQAVIGYGRAGKLQIALSVRDLISSAPLLPFDEADACAAALTHIFTFKE